jgi:hypothetical protein
VIPERIIFVSRGITVHGLSYERQSGTTKILGIFYKIHFANINKTLPCFSAGLSSVAPKIANAQN